jgi:hypothetical protein
VSIPPFRRIVAKVHKVLDGFARGLLTPRMVKQILGVATRASG